MLALRTDPGIKAYRGPHERRAALLRRAGVALTVCLLVSFLLISQRRLQLQLPRSVSVSLASFYPGSGCASQPAGAGGRHAGGGGGGAAAAPPASCELEVEPSQWADSCQLFRDACIDQGSIILYGPEHRVVTGGSTGTAPFELRPEPDQRRYIFVHRESVRGGGCCCRCHWGWQGWH